MLLELFKLPNQTEEMIKIRLKRLGRKKLPMYRIVAMPSKAKRDGASLEDLGFYNPMTNETHLNVPRIMFRIEQGAQPSETVRYLLNKAKIL